MGPASLKAVSYDQALPYLGLDELGDPSANLGVCPGLGLAPD